MKKENDILEETLSAAQNGYTEAYDFLKAEYEKNPKKFGPQTLYFLACLAGGADLPDTSLEWLRKAIIDNGWWYRPAVLEDDDLSPLKNNPEFVSLKSISDNRYAESVSKAKAVFTWERKTSDNIFLAVHGNAQNGRTAGEDWQPLLRESARWQLETIQSAEPDGYGTYRWSYDMESFKPVAEAMEKIQNEGYGKIVCGGFSAGCDMLLRAIAFTPARCDMLILQSPWIPILKDHAEELMNEVRRKNIGLKILCGSEDKDCLPMAQKLYEAASGAGIKAELTVQKGSRHQFSGDSIEPANFKGN